MARVKVSQSGGVVTVFEGGEAYEYRVESVDDGAAGVIEVSSGHLPSVLSSVPGSEWLDPPVDEAPDSAGIKSKPEAPAKTAASRRAGEPKPEAPAKEK